MQQKRFCIFSCWVNELKEREGGSHEQRRLCRAGSGMMWLRVRERVRERRKEEKRLVGKKNEDLSIWEPTNHLIGSAAPRTAALDCNFVV